MALELATRVSVGMDVCDANGDKVGAIARIHRPVGGHLLEVKTGVSGLGKPVFVPMSAVEDLTAHCVFLSAPKDDLDALGWHDRPDGLDDIG